MGLCFLLNNNNQDRTAAGFGHFFDLGSQLPIYLFLLSLAQVAELVLLALFSPKDGLVVHVLHASMSTVQTRARIR